MAQDAIDDFIALPQDQQLATLQKLPRANQDSLLQKVKQRRANTSPLPEGVKQVGTNSAGGRILAPEDVSAWDVFKKDIQDPEAWKNAGAAAWGELKAVPQGVASLFAPPESTGGKTALALAGPAGIAALAAKRLAGSELQSRGKLTSQAADQFKAGHPVLGSASTFLAGLPIPGVAGMGAGINDSMDSGDVSGGIGKGLADVGMLAVPEAARRLSPILAKGREAFVRNAASTGPDVAKELVKKTEAENTAAAEGRKDVVKKHFDKTHEDPTGTPIEGRSPTPDEQVSRRQAIEHGVERSDTEIKDELEKTYQTQKDAANAPYNELKGALQHDEADPEQMSLIIEDGMESVRGSETKPTVLKNMLDRWEALQKGTRSDPFNYDDLQGFREEIGRELRKGTLPPDVFDAYKKMNEGITNEMESIAKRADEREAQSRGGQQLPKEQTYAGKLKAARAGYRQYAETFLDKDSPIYKALNSTERGETVKAFQGKDQSGVQRLAKYNPDLAKRINTVRGLQEEAAKLPNEKPAKFEKPNELPPKEPPKKIGTKELTQANKESMAAKEKRVRTGYAPIVSTGLFIDAIRSAMEGNFGHAAMDVGARGVYEIGKQGFAKLLRNPNVIEALTRPTAAQIAAIPEQLRGVDLKPFIQEAQKQGIKVSPAILTAIGYSAHPTPPALKGSPLDEQQ